MGIEKADQDLGNGLLVRVSDEVVQDSRMGVHIGKNLLGLGSHQDSENLGEVTAEDWVEFILAVKEREEALKELKLIRLDSDFDLWDGGRLG